MKMLAFVGIAFNHVVTKVNTDRTAKWSQKGADDSANKREVTDDELH